MLTNATYIGHWITGNAIVRWNNHPAIVLPDVFMQAFNYLSPVTLEGHPNPHYRPFKQHTRPSREEYRPVERPLLAGIMYGAINDTWRPVGTTWLKDLEHYVYVHTTPKPDEHRLWTKTAHFVDEAVVTRLREKIRTTFDSQAWEENLATLNDKYELERKRILAQRNTLERVMANQIASLDTIDLPDMIRGVEARYKDSKAEHARLSAELALVEQEIYRLDIVADLKATCEPALNEWEKLSRNEKRVILRACIKRIDAREWERLSLHFVIHWLDNTQSEFILPKQTHNGWRHWLSSETDQLLTMVDRGASQVEIAQTFPDRTWQMIKYKVEKIRGMGSCQIFPLPIYHDETYPMYSKRAGEQATKHFTARAGNSWVPDEEALLLKLLDEQASQVEIAKALPHRKWGRIRAKITTLKGKGFPIPGLGAIRREETYSMYCARTGQTGCAEIIEPSVLSETSAWTIWPMPSC
jgi:hypothetical protein